MDIKITPKKLRGRVEVPPSKSVAHRMIIAAALAEGASTISNLSPSVDILSTIDCMRALGAEISFEADTAVIKGIARIPDKAVLNCNESGSTMRFLIPVACALGVNARFIGSGKLPQRPITPFVEEFPKHGITFDFEEAGASLPCSVSGKLTSGRFEIDGGLSSQFITGLLFALPLLDGDSEISLTTALNSRPYVDITLGVLRDFGVNVTETESGYFIKGNQRFKAFSGNVEGDYSQAAFFRVANSLGSELEIIGLSESSLQGDRIIMDICDKFDKSREPFEIDGADIPDLVPILTVLACFCRGTNRITNVARLRFKESDRLNVPAECLNAIGGKVTVGEDFIEIEGVESLRGGEIDGHNDHRIPMSLAVAATMCENPLVIRGAECVRKSFPDFFDVYRALGGDAEEV
ncbi:MAG: 3-phosphoshikimate 1-carboxyvinyltransferase [Oscillospiraceae bacterium]|nr:3-phosphoshikimate 1-carboxyvinyltransferase [Oscillospiraceae bacterium]